MNSADLAHPTAPVASQGTADGLRAALHGNGVLVAWFAMGSVPLLEMGAASGFDAAVIDLQHGLWDRLSAHLAVSALGGFPVIMRVAANSVHAIGEALDSGAHGILVPFVETAEQARLAVSAATFPQSGVRSGGGVRPLAEGFSRYHKRNTSPLIGVMVETALGVTNVEAIAKVDGVDFIFIGTGDLALSLGCFPEINRKHEDACQHVLSACLASSMPCGIFTGNAPEAKTRFAQGYVMTVGANDIDIVVHGFGKAGRVARGVADA